MRTKSIFMKNPIFQSCPGCGESSTLRKSRARNWRENFMDNLTFYKMYRCRQCGWRDYLSVFNRKALTLNKVLFYGVMIVVIAYVVKTVLGMVVK